VFGVTPISPPGFEIFPTLLRASVIITVKMAFIICSVIKMYITLMPVYSLIN
jgi:hypothetical protein